MMTEQSEIGEIVEGKLSGGLKVKLFTSTENVKLGLPVLVDTDLNTYYSVVSDVCISTEGAVESILGSPLELSMRRMREEHKQFMTQIKSSIDLNVLRKISKGDGSIYPFDTMPPHFSKCVPMRDDVFEKIYQLDEDFIVGNLRDFSEYKISIDADTLIDTSFGIFGSTGSGKSIFMKLLLCRLIEHKKCVTLIIDSMGEYGGISPDGMRGMKYLFPNDVVLYSLDEKNKEKDRVFKINPDNLTLGDLETIMKNLTDVMRYGLLNIANNKAKSVSLVEAINSPPASVQIHEGTLAGLQSRLSAILSYKFFDKNVNKSNDSLVEIKRMIIDDGKSVVVDLGRYKNNPNAYFIVATLLARVLYDEYSNKDESKSYPHLVVTLEEAHKYIHFQIWNNIAREMRKNKMVLAIIDQIPDSIDKEVMSQLNNRFVFKLNQDNDIRGALEGVDQSQDWRSIIKSFPMPRTLNPPRSLCFAYGSCISLPTILETMNFNAEVGRLSNARTKVITQDDFQKDRKSVL